HHFFVVVVVRTPRQAKCAFSRLSCRGAPAVASKACIFAFILLRCALRGKQSVHFLVYLVAVRSPWQAKREFSRLSCCAAPPGASKVCILSFTLPGRARGAMLRALFRVDVCVVGSS